MTLLPVVTREISETCLIEKKEVINNFKLNQYYSNLLSNLSTHNMEVYIIIKAMLTAMDVTSPTGEEKIKSIAIWTILDILNMLEKQAEENAMNQHLSINNLN